MSKQTKDRELQFVDEEERELVESLERGEWESVDTLEEARREAREYAAATLRKDQRMNIRITERDLRNLKIRAAEEGVPYQTLVTMILHKYVTGRLVDKQ